jgi:arylsulfatase A-like enzyme
VYFPDKFVSDDAPSRYPELKDRRIAWIIGLCTAAFGMLVQFEIYAQHISSGASLGASGSAGAAAVNGLRAFGIYVLAFPLLQLESLLIGSTVAAAYLLSAGRKSLRSAAIGLAVFVNVWPIIDQMSFNVLRQHITLFDEDVTFGGFFPQAGRLMGSMFAEADWIALLNVLLVAGGIWFVRKLARSEWRGEIRMPRVRLTTPVKLAMVAYAVIGVVLPKVVGTKGVHHHPVVALVALTRGMSALSLATTIVPDSVVRGAQYGVYPGDAAVDARLREFQELAIGFKRPNVLLVILESVGADQVLPGGKPDARITPNIAKLAQRAAIFPNLYTSYPATTRAHVPMMTGGSTITWGSVHEELTLPYRGATLPASFKTAGYRTGLFAAVDMRFGALAKFYGSMPWDTLLHFGNGTGPLQPTQKVHSWGVNESHLWTHAKRWVDAGGKDAAPFFLNFQTVSTHHPYGTESGFKGPRDTLDQDRKPRYLNALAYTDKVLGQVLADLEASGKLKHTLIVITGDHGQAFGDKHENNIAHRNFLYEENVRTFAMFVLPSSRGTVVSERIGTTADLMPSVLSLLGMPLAKVDGQSLFARRFDRRLAYFHKDVPPQQWGLRDGNWKFIDELTNDAPELYDLSKDPSEQVNLAGENPQLVTEYRGLVADWFVRANYEYIAHLSGYRPPLIFSLPRTRTARAN